MTDSKQGKNSAAEITTATPPTSSNPSAMNVAALNTAEAIEPLKTLEDVSLPNIEDNLFHIPSSDHFANSNPISSQAPKFLLLYGSLRTRSYSRLVVEECARILIAMGAEVKIFNPAGLPLADSEEDSHPKVQELRALVMWCEGMVWCSPERHGAMTGIMKTQIDWIPLSLGAVRPPKAKP